MFRLEISTLHITPSNFLLLDLNKPLIPMPQILVYSPEFYLLPKKIESNYSNSMIDPSIEQKIKNSLNFKNSLNLILTQKTLETSSGMSYKSFFLELFQKIKHLHHPPSLSEEQFHQSYILTLENQKLVLISESEDGFEFGLSTLSQLIHQNQNLWVIQKTTIVDFPHIVTRISNLPILTFPNQNQDITINIILSGLRYKLNGFIINQEYFSFFQNDIDPSLKIVGNKSEKWLKIIPDRDEVSKSEHLHLKNINWICPIFDIAEYSAKFWNPNHYSEDDFQRAFITDFFGMYNPHLLWELYKLIRHFDHDLIYDFSFFEEFFLTPQENHQRIFEKHHKRHHLSSTFSTILEMIDIVMITITRNKEIFIDFRTKIMQLKDLYI